MLLIIILVLVLFGAGGYCGYRSYGAAALGGALGLVFVILMAIWLFGGFSALHPV
jgi:hypothetical protein